VKRQCSPERGAQATGLGADPAGAMSKTGTSSASLGLAPAVLGRIKLFADLKEYQIEQFLGFVELVRVPQYSDLVRQGQHGDAMYVVLEGELRALTIVEGKESTLATIGAGECFGEISLLDHGLRSADVVANRDTSLLKLSSAAFERLLREAPALALPFVLALSRALVDRVRRTTKRYEDTIRFIRTSRAAH
jgi:CRP-like cAMP-binding protein